MRMGRGSNEIDQPSSWAGAVTQKSPVNAQKDKRDQPTNRQSDHQSGQSCLHITKKWVTNSWFSSCQFLFETGQVAYNLMGIKGIDQFVEVYSPKGKDKPLVLMPKVFKICINGFF